MCRFCFGDCSTPFFQHRTGVVNNNAAVKGVPDGHAAVILVKTVPVCYLRFGIFHRNVNVSSSIKLEAAVMGGAHMKLRPNNTVSFMIRVVAQGQRRR
jgi:hypothetical protein